MTQEQEPRPRDSESIDDYHLIAKAILEAVANNSTGVLGGQIIDNVQATTGKDSYDVAITFQELADQGVLERCLSDPWAGVVLTEAGKTVYQNYDRLMGLE